MSRYLLSFKKAIKPYLRVFFYFISFFYSTLFVTLKGKNQTYMICTVQVSNNRQLNTLITVHREVERDPSKKKNAYILCTQTKVLLQKNVLLNREDLFEPPKKNFNLG